MVKFLYEHECHLAFPNNSFESDVTMGFHFILLSLSVNVALWSIHTGFAFKAA